MKNIEIIRVRSPEDIAAATSLFKQYVDWLALDLAFQDFATEISQMPGKYAPPRGELLLARIREDSDGTGDGVMDDRSLSLSAHRPTWTPVGCVALRPLSHSICEMKRLYVVDAAKSRGIGRRLATEIIGIAKDLGYDEIRLDTLPRMAAAVAMYRSLGFGEVDAYYETPVEGTVFLALRLGSG